MTFRGVLATSAGRKVNLPKAIRLVQILDAQVKADAPTAIMEVESEKGFVGLRVSGATGGVSWKVDLYGGNCYIVRIDGFESEQRTTPLHVVHLLQTRLPSC
jgi:hypothetical protein